MPLIKSATRARMRIIAAEELSEAREAVLLAKAKGNPAFLAPLIAILIPKIVKLGLLYFGLKTGYRIADQVSAAIAHKVGEELGNPPPVKKGK